MPRVPPRFWTLETRKEGLRGTSSVADIRHPVLEVIKRGRNSILASRAREAWLAERQSSPFVRSAARYAAEQKRHSWNGFMVAAGANLLDLVPSWLPVPTQEDLHS